MSSKTTNTPKTLLQPFQWMMLVLILAMAATVSAQQDEPLFFIEKITVDGLLRASSAILVSESRLETGREYTEDQLRKAVYRINRLPFVIDARFSLRKGSERDTYELVITVEETERFFFGFDGSYELDPEYSDNYSSTLTAGIRQFVGAGGVLYGSVQPRYDSYSDNISSSYNIGYTQYNLFDKPLSLSLGLAYSDDDFGKQEAYSFGLGFQLPQNQSLRLAWNGRKNESSWPRVVEFIESPEPRAIVVEACDHFNTIQFFELEWRFDTTDDLLLPTRGTLISAQASYYDRKSEVKNKDYGNFVDSESSQKRLSLTGKRFYSLADQHSFSLLAGLWYNQNHGYYFTFPYSDDRYDQRGSWYGIRAGAEYSWDLLQTAPRELFRDLRWQSTVELLHGSYLSSDQDFYDHDYQRLKLSTGLVLRNRWGVFRLVLSYEDRFGE